ncbi:NIPA-like protein [Senna tora]|uniref:NIPA-like protein n=1 Tax=Senna tora TaxID=362788 RepID=A0A834SKY7_9FABA|nr:NIPA-like protein [Senna tora]
MGDFGGLRRMGLDHAEQEGSVRVDVSELPFTEITARSVMPTFTVPIAFNLALPKATITELDVHNSEKRFLSVMDKLFHAPKSVPHSSTSSSRGAQLSGGKKRSYESTLLAAMESNLKGNVAEGQQSSAPSGAQCRPWDRGDFMKRLATFKSISWFAKPKVVSAVNCARRGWINVDVDTIACESCGARLFFSTPASWNKQQVEKAALVFSLKLDSGHKLLCPWVDNACDESVARFPPTPPPVLVDNFRERCSALMKLSALPRISLSAVEFMKGPLLEDLLEHSLMLEGGNGSSNNSEIEHLSSQLEVKLYYQAQKLISLCGWNPRSLPYVIDCKDTSDQSVKNTNIFDYSHLVADGKNNSLIVHSTNADESLKTDYKSYNGEQMDPNSVVLDCSLCGATIGLWAFCTLPRPVELFRLVGFTEINGENDFDNSFNKRDLENRQGVTSSLSDVATSSKNNSSSLNMTIAGGPPPTKQNFKATISFPVIGQNLRARLSYDSDFRDQACVDGDSIEPDSQKSKLQEKIDCTFNDSTTELVPLPSERTENSEHETASQASIDDSVVHDVIPGTQNEEHPSSCKDVIPIHVESDGMNSSDAVDPSSSQQDLTEGKALSVTKKTLGVQLGSPESHGVKDGVKNSVNNEDLICTSGKYLKQLPSNKTMEFDPIRQHRHFCPWIASINDEEPGWKQTLSALYYQKNRLHSSPHRSPSSTSIVQVDDPIGSVRKLFMSPSARRMKLPRISGDNTEQR